MFTAMNSRHALFPRVCSMLLRVEAMTLMTDLWSGFWYWRKKISIVKSVGGKKDSS